MNKTCPYCSEDVKFTAKVCPHCRNWLSIFSLRNPAVAMASALMIYIIPIVVLIVFLKHVMSPGLDFSPYRNSISVVESRMDSQPDQSGPLIYVVVVLTNTCEMAWKSPQLDLRFYNKAGSLIDAVAYTGSGVIYPSGELAVKVKNRPIHATEEYDSCKVFVRSAVDPRVRF